MIVAVGSRNSTKLESVRLAFRAPWPDVIWDVIGCSVDSTVPAQPMSDKEAHQGARVRARRVLETIRADYGVGLEGGLQNFEDHWFNSAWAVVIDKTGREGIGTTIRMKVAPAVMQLVMEGKELAEACDQIFGVDNTKEGAGYFGLMTSNAINKTSAFRDAVLAALASFIHPELTWGVRGSNPEPMD